MGAYREPAVVNMYDEQKPLASRGDCDLMALERVGTGWVGSVRHGHVTTRYVSREGILWFEEQSGDRVEVDSTVDRLLTDRSDYVKAMKAVGR